jgi:hypothetical protein
MVSSCDAKYRSRHVLYLPAHEDLPDYAIANKLTPFISMQNHYNLVYREEEREMFPTLQVGHRRCSASLMKRILRFDNT